jgi:hypothetical protein
VRGVQVPTLIGERVSRIVAFNDLTLVPVFGLPSTLSRQTSEPHRRVRSALPHEKERTSSSW